jgi:hypothetical protein
MAPFHSILYNEDDRGVLNVTKKMENFGSRRLMGFLILPVKGDFMHASLV